jgi:hypothetical protein
MVKITKLDLFGEWALFNDINHSYNNEMLFVAKQEEFKKFAEFKRQRNPVQDNIKIMVFRFGKIGNDGQFELYDILDTKEIEYQVNKLGCCTGSVAVTGTSAMLFDGSRINSNYCVITT